MSRFRRLIGPVRPALHDEIDSAVSPTYARREEVTDVRRVVEDAIDGSTLGVAVLGRSLAALASRVEALEDEVERLRGDRSSA
ncbi:MAG TPA: hypothetical protein VMY34_10285 [Acidimicrobiales bacterium]|nr:hypothetical protein [Acidimicrobiales bacterium]